MAIESDLQVYAHTALRSLGDDPAAHAAAAALLGLASSHDATLEHIDADLNLSELGQAHARTTALGALDAKVGIWSEKVLTPLASMEQAQLEALRLAAAPAPVSELEAVRRELRNAEIRRSVADLDPVFLQGNFHDLPPQIQDAMRDAPPMPVRADSGAIVWVEVAPSRDTLTSPQLKQTQKTRAALEGLMEQLRSLVDPAGQRMAKQVRRQRGQA
ncbi:MAG: hypothetical protein O3A51_07470 [Verrucomicrobia bacterium]|nr:hypothetical protein [Verrucomicrobiota bacterium]